MSEEIMNKLLINKDPNFDTFFLSGWKNIVVKGIVNISTCLDLYRVGLSWSQQEK